MPELTEVIKRPRARKLKGSLGPYATGFTTYDAGKDREIEITVSAQGILYRLKGQSEAYLLPHTVGVIKAMSLRAGASVDPRQGRIKRGGQNI